MAAALQIWSHTFSRAFEELPSGVRETVQRKIDEMGTRLENFPHQRLQGRPECKLRVGDGHVDFLKSKHLNPVFQSQDLATNRFVVP